MLKLYVLIRDDLSDAQQAVQAGHALAQFASEHPQEFKAWQDDNNTLIYLSVTNIHWWKQVLADGNFKHSMFHEPDYTMRSDHGGSPFASGGTYTAIAVAPNWACQYILFKDLPLAFPSKSKSRQTKRWWQ